MFNKNTVLLVTIFLAILVLTIVFNSQLESAGFHTGVLQAGNAFIFIITLISLQLLSKGLHAEKTQAFLRNAYSGIMVKLFSCAAAAFIYILAAGKTLNKPALFACMGLYMVYTFAELSVILKQSNAKKHVKN